MVVDEGQAVACHMARGDVEGSSMKIMGRMRRMRRTLVVILVLVIGHGHCCGDVDRTRQPG